MGRAHGDGHGARIRVECQSPLPQEGDAEREGEDAADPAGHEGAVPPPDEHLRNTSHIRRGCSCQEPDEHRLMQGHGGEDQQRDSGQKRPDGYPAAVTHVTHGTNSP